MTALDRNMNAAFAKSKRTRRATQSQGRIATGISVHLPYWDVDLGSVQPISGITLFLDAGAQMQDFWVLVSEAPFVSDSLAAMRNASDYWAYHHKCPAKGVARIAVPHGVSGRFLRVQMAIAAKAIPLSGLDIAVPDPTDALSVAEISRLQPRRARPKPLQTGEESNLTLRFDTIANTTYALSFDHNSPADPVHVWWNGQLLLPADFDVAADEKRTTFHTDVTGTGGENTLTFGAAPSAGNAELPRNISFKQKAPVPTSARPPETKPNVGTLAGILRRKPALQKMLNGVDDDVVLRCLEELMGDAPRDEIVFR